MIEIQILDRLLWAGLGGFLALVIALAVCRPRRIHSGLKVWACRAAMLKMLIALAFTAPIPMAARGNSAGSWITAELCWFLVLLWAAGASVVGLHGFRAYRASHRLMKSAFPQREKISGISVREVAGLPELCIVGVVRQTLLVPRGTDLDRAVLQHELAHVRHWDAPFGLLAWVVTAIFWFVPGCGRLVAEHSLWQEVWADESSRIQLNLEPRSQATALLNAISRGQSAPAAALGYRGEAKAVSRRIEAMFAGKPSNVLAMLALLVILGSSVPVKAKVRDSGGQAPRRGMVFAPVATMSGR